MTGPIANDYQTLKAGAQAMSQFGQSLQQMAHQFKQIHQQLKEHCSGDESGLGAAVQGAAGDTAEAGGDVFAAGGRVLGEMGSRTDTNTERTFSTDQKIADTFSRLTDGELGAPTSGGGGGSGGSHAAGANSPVGPSSRIENARPYRPGGLDHDDVKWQQDMEDAFPKDANGNPAKFADPRDAWLGNGNDGGAKVPGRANNCADCSRSFLESWYGRPTCAQPRIVDPALGPNDLRAGEGDSLLNMRSYAGGPETVESNYLKSGSPDTAAGYQQIADKLTAAGPGSAAVVEALWKGVDKNGKPTFSGGHAFNAVNHQGTVLWVDMQQGTVSENPPYLHAGAVASIVLDSNGKKI